MLEEWEGGWTMVLLSTLPRRLFSSFVCPLKRYIKNCLTIFSHICLKLFSEYNEEIITTTTITTCCLLNIKTVLVLNIYNMQCNESSIKCRPSAVRATETITNDAEFSAIQPVGGSSNIVH